jgi:hypothetical protein
MNEQPKRPKWLDEFENLANSQLASGSACSQIHPIVERWYQKLQTQDRPPSRDSVMQAISCLSTELIEEMPSEIFEAVSNNDLAYDQIAIWIQQILMVGRAFQLSLDRGELDDL